MSHVILGTDAAIEALHRFREMRRKRKPKRSKASGYAQYSKTALRDAYNAVMQKKMSVYMASSDFNVPYMTLHDRVKGKIALEAPMGRRCMLTVAQEKQLVHYFKHLFSIGYGYSKCEFLQIVTDHAIHCGSRKKTEKIKVGKIWYYSFLKRHPDVVSVRPHQRPSCASQMAIERYYSELESFLLKHSLLNKPSSTFCLDKVDVEGKESRNSSCIAAEGSHVFLIAAGSALGFQIPPYFVFPGVNKLPKITNTTPGTSGCVCLVNWIDGDVFKKYLFEHFLPLARSSGTDDSLLLLYDGHKFPMFPGLMDWAKEKKLFLFPLPPHCSCVQKDDLSLLDEFSDVYAQIQSSLDKQRIKSSGIPENTTCQICCQAYAKIVIPDSLSVFFKSAGIIPFDSVVLPRPLQKPLQIKSRERNDDDDDDDDDSVSSEETAACQTRKQRNVIGKQMGSKPGPSQKKKTKLQSDSEESSGEYKDTEDESDSDLDAVSECGEVVFEDDEQKCCVCRKLEPPDLEDDVSIVIVEWVQCDACSHWTHLRFCTKVGLVGGEEEFRCPHCVTSN